MPFHPSTFDYLKPTAGQLDKMETLRGATRAYAATVELALRDGPDKSYIMRKIREIGMWANVAITRLPDGTPRGDEPNG